eukprot:CAMPEP_0181079758 /NCGR_PEP_ID=MMETSP1071-20121207/2199_1 /TAXON_ID=35127 /ORGANISM="Thalassiosira sp., Strain NH16" /LENGTH=542 /DNA_ID=CAMNT_0023161179 /DNA_START=421 /DNA_END=2045 /DNA_ORIENTATION=+
MFQSPPKNSRPPFAEYRTPEHCGLFWGGGVIEWRNNVSTEILPQNPPLPPIQVAAIPSELAAELAIQADPAELTIQAISAEIPIQAISAEPGSEEIPQDLDPEDEAGVFTLLLTEAGDEEEKPAPAKKPRRSARSNKRSAAPIAEEPASVEPPRRSARNKRSAALIAEEPASVKVQAVLCVPERSSAAPIAEEPLSAQRAVAPEDLTQPDLNQQSVKIWSKWVPCLEEMSSIPTIDNQTVIWIAPMLSWFSSAPLVMLWLHYCPLALAELLDGRHPSAAMNSDGTLMSATWEFLRLSLGDQYSSCGKMNIIPFMYEYRGQPTDIYTPENFRKIMEIYAEFVLQVFGICDRNVLCSKGVMSRVQTHILRFGGGLDGTDRFHKWFSGNASFFSLIPCHPEMVVSPALRARFLNGLPVVCEVSDRLYTKVRRFISGIETLACTVAYEILHTVKGSPGYSLMLEAQRQGLQRAIETQRRLVAENKHHFQDPEWRAEHDDSLLTGLLQANETNWFLGEAAWDEKIQQLKKYREEHGHCNVPQRGTDA